MAVALGAPALAAVALPVAVVHVAATTNFTPDTPSGW